MIVKNKVKMLELTSDVVFKAFMISEKTKEYKAKLLSEITKIPEEVLIDAKYITKELNPKNKNAKIYRTDIFVEIKDRTTLILEMNNDKYKDVITKTLHYSFRTISESLDRSSNYNDTIRHIEINFNNFSLDKSNRVIKRLGITDLDSHEVVTELWKGYIVDLALLRKGCYNEDEKKLAYLLQLFSEENLEKIKGDKVMEEAMDELERISSDEKIIGLYDVEKREKMIRNSMIIEAEEKGHEKGLKESKIEIAKKMLNDKLNIEIISKYTGLSIEEIKSLNK